MYFMCNIESILTLDGNLENSIEDPSQSVFQYDKNLYHVQQCETLDQEKKKKKHYNPKWKFLTNN